MYRYRDTIRYEPDTRLDDVEEFADKVREFGVTNSVAPGEIVFSVEADDLWDLREKLDEIEIYVGSYGINLILDKEHVEEEFAGTAPWTEQVDVP